MQHREFAEGECYHVYNRGVEKRIVFAADTDYGRFLFSLFACAVRRLPPHDRRAPKTVPLARQLLAGVAGQLVDILCFCLMPNHFHLLLRQRVADGVPLYLQKLMTAYTMYFNKRYEHSGVLFQGTYQSRHVDRDEYLLPVSRYIHLNPLDLTTPGSKERGIVNPSAAHQALLQYPWSSYGEYAGQPRYQPLVSTDLLLSILGSADRYAAYVTRGPSIVSRAKANVYLP